MARPVRDPSETLELPHDDHSSTSVSFRPPRTSDARSIWQLARDSGSLDLNSPYAYLLAGHHFASTSLVAEAADGSIVGFVLAYRPPDDPDQLFVWQVTVDKKLRGAGIARQLLDGAIARTTPHGVTTLTATVTPSNEASRRLFQSVARDHGADYSEQSCFGADLFPGEGHEPEHEISISPLS